MPFLRGTTPIWSTQDLPRRFKEWKACFVEIGQRAHKLERDARDNFPKVENLAYQCMEKGGGCLTVAFRHNIETNSSS